MSCQELNAAAIDRRVDEGWEWGQPISHEDYVRAARGEWDVLLTPTKKAPHAWFGDLRGKKLLGLASGGGQRVYKKPYSKEKARQIIREGAGTQFDPKLASLFLECV